MVDLYIITCVWPAQEEHCRGRVWIDEGSALDFAGRAGKYNVCEVTPQYIVSHVASAYHAPAIAKYRSTIAGLGCATLDLKLGESDCCWRIIDR